MDDLDIEQLLDEDHEARIAVLEARVEELEGKLMNALTPSMAEFAITKFTPTANDFIVFWLPEEYTKNDAFRAAQGLNGAIQGAFRFSVFIKGRLDMQLIEGNKGGIILPT